MAQDRLTPTLAEPTTVLCWGDRFHPQREPCSNKAVWKSVGLGNIVDGWTWCYQHAPSKDYRTPVEAPDADPR